MFARTTSRITAATVQGENLVLGEGTVRFLLVDEELAGMTLVTDNSMHGGERAIYNLLQRDIPPGVFVITDMIGGLEVIHSAECPKP